MSELKQMIHRLNSEHSLKNIYHIIFSRGQRVAIEYTNNNIVARYTYDELDRKNKLAAKQLSLVLSDEKKGSFIAIKLENRPDWSIIFWAVLMAGFKPLLLDINQNQKLSEYLIFQASAIALITSSSLHYKGVKTMNVNDLLHQSTDMTNQSNNFHWENQIALCTSGTTDNSKIFVYSGESLCNHVYATEKLYRANKNIIPSSKSRVLSFLPLHHGYGFLTTFLWPMLLGSTVIFPRYQSFFSVNDACKLHKVNYVTAVPIMINNFSSGIEERFLNGNPKMRKTLNALLELSNNLQRLHPVVGMWIARKILFRKLNKKLLGHHTKMLICGASHTPKENLKLMNLLGYCTLYGYGLTDAGFVCSLQTSQNLDDRVNGSVGEVFSCFESKIKPLDHENPNTGELLLKSKCLPIGKMVSGELNPLELDAEGWFNTNDIVQTEGNNLWVIGRNKDVIINESGENVYPDEIEDFYIRLPEVSSRCVIGIERADGYETITLVLFIRGAYNDDAIIKRHIEKIDEINQSISYQKRIQSVIFTKNPLPSANRLKLKKLKLKSQIENNEIEYKTIDMKSSHKEIIRISSEKVIDKYTPFERNSPLYIEIKQKIYGCLSQALDIPLENITDTTLFIDDLSVDSLSSTNIFFRLYEKFHLDISPEDFYKCNQVKELTDMIYTKYLLVNEIE